MDGDKIADLQTAAKDLIDIVVWGDQSKYTSKVALAPFAPAVNVGTYFTKITNKSDDPDPDGDGYNYPSSCYNKKGQLKGTCDGNSKYKAKVWAKCVVERVNPLLGQFTDAGPGTLLGEYLTAWNDAPGGNSSSTCDPQTAVVPLTSDRTKLKNTIDTFKANGSTAGQLGTAFAWYMLSPKWSTVWPAESTPAPYGTPKLKKIAILMTDGEYNTIQGQQFKDGSSQATTALNNAKTLCTAMKVKLLPGDPNIEIYTVGFKLTTTASKNLLKNCATDASHYYETTSGDGLKAAFRDIALKISRLRLTN
jgi:hypothetical protein